MFSNPDKLTFLQLKPYEQLELIEAFRANRIELYSNLGSVWFPYDNADGILFDCIYRVKAD